MTSQQLLDDQKAFFGDFPKEPIDIGTEESGIQTYECINTGHRQMNEWQMGGLGEMPRVSVIIERNAIDPAKIPPAGAIVNYRGERWIVLSITKDHLESPITLELDQKPL